MANRVDWDAAFERWLGEELTWTQVGAAFGVTKRTVERAAKRLHWMQRREEIRRQARARQEARLVRSLTERNADTIRIVDAARVKFVQQLSDRDFRLTGADLVGFLKLEQLIEGQATSRVVGLNVARVHEVLDAGQVTPEQVEGFIAVWRALQLGDGPIIDAEVLEIEAGEEGAEAA